ncbi:MAG: amidohydrolase family protein [Acidimicrobiales bacterium]
MASPSRSGGQGRAAQCATSNPNPAGTAGPWACPPGRVSCRHGAPLRLRGHPDLRRRGYGRPPDGGRGRRPDLAGGAGPWAAGAARFHRDRRSGPTLPPEVLRAVVEEAHAAGLKVTSHLGSLAELQIALDAGVDELAHGLWSDEEIPDALIHRMVAQGMVVVPTLHIHPSPTRLRNLGRFVDARGRVVYGTDMGNLGPPPGVDPEELALMVGAGMTPLRALSAATSDAARHLALPGRGRIVPGALADLLLVEGNPLEDLSTLARPVLVMREGRVAG